jgi:hypothetical protein
LPEPAEEPAASNVTERRLQRRWLTLWHSVWGAIAALTLIVFIASLPVYWAQLQVVCRAVSCPPGQSTPAAAHALQGLGLTLGAYATYQVVLQVVVTAISWIVAAVLFWRKSDDWLAGLAGLFLITEFASTQNGPLYVLEAVSSVWTWPVNLVLFLGQVTLCLFFFLFPDGRFVPGWTRWLAVATLALSIPQSFFPGAPGSWSDVLSTAGFFLLVAAIMTVQIYRYWRVSTDVHRQQTKWVVLSIVIVILVGVVPALLFPSVGQPGTLGDLLETSGFTLVITLIPLSIGISISRYRLWDIDTLINQALVYGLLTGLLGAVFAGLILGLESLAGAITGATNQPIALVISTLAVAALFLPVRQRIQAIIDQRFYRKKYDAEKTLAAFSTTLRQEMDLEHVHEHLVAAVQETMQPAHVSLWLRPLERHSTDRSWTKG